MLTALDAPAETLDDQEKNFAAQVREHGWFRTSVVEDEDGPGFSYTTGLWSGAAAPEIIVFSLQSETAHNILWDVYRGVAAGGSLLSAQRVSTVFADRQAIFLPVSKMFYREYLGWSRWFYGGDDWPCWQLIWPDTRGAFPWESGYEDRFAKSQPNLTGEDWAAI